MNLHRRVAALDAARRRRQDTFVAALGDDDLVALLEVEGAPTASWRGNPECEAALRAVEEAAAGVEHDPDLGAWQAPAVRRAARRLVEAVKAQGYELWREESG